jgi:hypothetical protein
LIFDLLGFEKITGERSWQNFQEELTTESRDQDSEKSDQNYELNSAQIAK